MCVDGGSESSAWIRAVVAGEWEGVLTSLRGGLRQLRVLGLSWANRGGSICEAPLPGGEGCLGQGSAAAAKDKKTVDGLPLWGEQAPSCGESGVTQEEWAGHLGGGETAGLAWPSEVSLDAQQEGEEGCGR